MKNGGLAVTLKLEEEDLGVRGVNCPWWLVFRGLVEFLA